MTTRPGVRLTDDDELRQLYLDDVDAQRRDGAHPSEDDWVALTSDTLEPELRDSMADHVVGCADCAAIHRALTDLRREAADVDPAAPALADVSSTPWWLRYGAVAAAALVVVALAAALLSRPAPVASPGPPSSTAASTSAPAAAASPLPAPWAASIVALDVRMPASLVMTLRGETSRDAARRQGLVRDLRPALDLYRRGAWAEAARALEPIAQAHATEVEIAFYAGLAHLLAGHAAPALPLLESAIGSDLVGEDARWFVAVAHERLGAHDHAVTLLRSLCADGGPRSRAACQALQDASR